MENPNSSRWAQDMIHEICILEEVVLRLQNEQSEILDMYGSMSVAAKNYDKLISAFKEKKQELRRRLEFVVTKSSEEDKG